MRLHKILIIFALTFAFFICDFSIALLGQEVDLVEMQKKEKERRKKLKEENKETKHVFTDDDLKNIKKERINLTEVKKNKEEQTQGSGKKSNQDTDSTQKQEVREPEEVKNNEEKANSTSNSDGEYSSSIQVREKINLDTSTIGEGSKSPQMSDEEYWRNQRKLREDQITRVEDAIKQEDERLKQLKNALFINTPDLVEDQIKLRKEIEESEKRVKEYDGLLKEAKNQLEEFYDLARKEGIPPGWLRD